MRYGRNGMALLSFQFYFVTGKCNRNIDNDVTHRKIFTLSKLLVIFYTLKYGEFITYMELLISPHHNTCRSFQLFCLLKIILKKQNPVTIERHEANLFHEISLILMFLCIYVFFIYFWFKRKLCSHDHNCRKRCSTGHNSISVYCILVQIWFGTINAGLDIRFFDNNFLYELASEFSNNLRLRILENLEVFRKSKALLGQSLVLSICLQKRIFGNNSFILLPRYFCRHGT